MPDRVYDLGDGVESVWHEHGFVNIAPSIYACGCGDSWYGAVDLPRGKWTYRRRQTVNPDA